MDHKFQIDVYASHSHDSIPFIEGQAIRFVAAIPIPPGHVDPDLVLFQFENRFRVYLRSWLESWEDEKDVNPDYETFEQLQEDTDLEDTELWLFDKKFYTIPTCCYSLSMEFTFEEFIDKAVGMMFNRNINYGYSKWTLSKKVLEDTMKWVWDGEVASVDR